MGSHITTYTKVHIEVLDPRIEQFFIEDIAHALSMMTRANGHYPEFYSVGQHSLDCMREAKSRNYSARVVLACLLHDASEAYISDITRPVKKDLTMYLQVEKQLQDLIYQRFLGELPTEKERELVKSVDDANLYYEFLHFMDEKLFDGEPLLLTTPDYRERPRKEVEAEFIESFEKWSKLV